MADRMAWGKEWRLDIDAEYFAELWINSHEACPGWQPRPDPAFGDSYLGNGHFPTWWADVARRQLQRAARRRSIRYLGESILTLLAPTPSTNFQGINDVVRRVHVDDDGDGVGDRSVTIAMPVLHLPRIGLLNWETIYQVLPEQTIERPRRQRFCLTSWRHGSGASVLTQCRWTRNADLDADFLNQSCDWTTLMLPRLR